MIPSYKFLKKISKKIKTYIRPAPSKHWFYEGEYLKGIKDNIKFDNHEFIYEKMVVASEFSIHNSFDTTAIKSISLNNPTFICVDRKNTEFNSEANKYLKELVREKIYFYSFNELYSFLSSISFDVKEWWHSKKVHKITNASWFS